VVGSAIAAVFVGICLILLWLTSDFLVDWLWFSAIGYRRFFGQQSAPKPSFFLQSGPELRSSFG